MARTPNVLELEQLKQLLAAAGGKDELDRWVALAAGKKRGRPPGASRRFLEGDLKVLVFAERILQSGCVWDLNYVSPPPDQISYLRPIDYDMTRTEAIENAVHILCRDRATGHWNREHGAEETSTVRRLLSRLEDPEFLNMFMKVKGRLPIVAMMAGVPHWNSGHTRVVGIIPSRIWAACCAGKFPFPDEEG